MGIPTPNYPKSRFIRTVHFDKTRIHKGDGDMWPLTWADDGHLYGAAGDNMGSPMNFWRIEGDPYFFAGLFPFLVDNLPLDPAEYCTDPQVHPKIGLKPAGIICVDGVLYWAVVGMNYGEERYGFRQRNVHGWIITSHDHGKTWNRQATDRHFFTGRVAAPSFLQFGKNNAGARDEFVYAYFASSKEGVSFWENGDEILLGRVHQERILDRAAWTFYGGLVEGEPVWVRDDREAVPVFEYPYMTGENHVNYNAGLGRYIMGNYGFVGPDGNPLPYHANEEVRGPSQLTLFEAREPWGPWKLFYREDNWGTFGDYNPTFPPKWMSEDGKTMYLVSSGSLDDYNFTVQKVTLEIDEEER